MKTSCRLFYEYFTGERIFVFRPINYQCLRTYNIHNRVLIISNNTIRTPIIIIFFTFFFFFYPYFTFKTRVDDLAVAAIHGRVYFNF